MVAELLTEQGDLGQVRARVGATAGVAIFPAAASRTANELQLLLRLRYRIRVDLGLDEDDYDRMLDATHRQG